MRKIKRKFSIKIILCFILIFFGLFLFLNVDKLTAIYKINVLGYDKDTINVFFDEKIYEDVIKYDYSETLDKIANTEYFKKENYNDYLSIDYVDEEDFFENINLLLNVGYDFQEINNMYINLSNESINLLTKEEYFKDINNILILTFFKEEKLSRYISYYKKEIDKDIETIVTYVNIGLDNDYYTNVYNISREDDFLVLVNKYNQLSKSYVPENLRNVSYGSGKLRKEASIAFDKMCEAAKKDNIRIYGGSGYRSYSYQNNLYNNYVKRDGKKIADTYAARAGYSEHQTGLAMDILNRNWDYIDENDKEYNWLINNSYKFGFILRYLKGKEGVTGYQFEPWHFRYVGIDTAKEIYDLNITYDEYVAVR